MAKYLFSIYQPQGEPPPQDQLDAIMSEVDQVNKEMQAAGVWVFAGGLDFPSTATVLTTGQDGEPVLTDGPFVELKEYLGGLDIIDVPDLDAALFWARKVQAVIGLPIEIRPFFNQYQ